MCSHEECMLYMMFMRLVCHTRSLINPYDERRISMILCDECELCDAKNAMNEMPMLYVSKA